jgi:hypothetical protein
MTKKEKEGESNIYSLENLLSFPIKVNNNNNNNNSKKSKTLRCNCWVCNILDSSTEAAAEVATTTGHYYEPYNIVSENGDSIYSPEYEEITTLLDDDYHEQRGQVFISETAIEEVVNRIIDQKRLGSSLNNIKNGN